MKYISVLIVLLFVTYGQLILKHQVNKIGAAPSGNVGQLIPFFGELLTDVGILSGLAAAAVAALAWLYAISKFELSSVYPLLSINFILVPLLSILLFNEAINTHKAIGVVIIVLGIVVFSKGL